MGSLRKNVYGTPGSDAVTYSISTVSTGALIDDAKWNEIRTVVLRECTRRSTSATISTASEGALVYTTNYNTIASAINAWKAVTTISTVTTSSLITASQVNILISRVIAAGKICLCNCNYCTCNCNYCTCNCNYCPCNCNYSCTCQCAY